MDVTILLKQGKLVTSLYVKPTDAHIYLNKCSSHPTHVVRNIPKGQFIRIRRICTYREDYIKHSNNMIKHFQKRGYSYSKLLKIQKLIADTPREDLLRENIKTKKDPQTVFVTDWHSNFSFLPSILKKHYHIIQNDPYLKEVFPEKPTVAYRKVKTIRNYVTKNDVSPQKINSQKTTVPCGNCKLCKNIQTIEHIHNAQKNIKIKLKGGGNCKTESVIYAATCTKHQVTYIGHTGDKLSERFSRHRHDIKKRPENSELAAHFHQNHSDEDMKITILEAGFETKAERIRSEDKWICQLQTIQPFGINTEISSYGKEMYDTFTKTFS